MFVQSIRSVHRRGQKRFGLTNTSILVCDFVSNADNLGSSIFSYSPPFLSSADLTNYKFAMHDFWIPNLVKVPFILLLRIIESQFADNFVDKYGYVWNK